MGAYLIFCPAGRGLLERGPKLSFSGSMNMFMSSSLGNMVHESIRDFSNMFYCSRTLDHIYIQR